MGLYTSHDAFSGSYSAFHHFRGAILEAIGGRGYGYDDPDDGCWYWDDETYSPETHPGLHILLCHSDCGGAIEPEDCAKVAHDLELLRPAFAEMKEARGHLARLGYLGTLDRFIAGCRAAAEEGEPLRFDGGLTERELAEHDQAEEAAS